jgi:hypothetical protein
MRNMARLWRCCWRRLGGGYPSRQAFLDMIGSAEYEAIGYLRTEALVRGELHPMDPAST